MNRRIHATDREVSAITRLSFWKLQAMGWTAFYVVLLLARLPNHVARRDITGSTLAVAAMFLGSCMLEPVCRWVLQRPKRWLATEARVFLWSFAVGTFWRLALQLLDARRPLSVGIVQFTVVLFLWCNLYLSIKQWARLMRAETAALRYQLNPHFLFNALNGVSTLVVESNAPAATQMLAQISDYLRATLEADLQTEVPLSDEIAFTDRYLAIEQSRLAGRLCIERRIDPEAWDAAVPSLLLQPLVENAVRHGIAPLMEGGTLGIHCGVRDEHLCVTVHNSAPPRPAHARQGVGLVNTAERLRALYGSDHHFGFEWLDSGGCQATIRVPFRRMACAS